MRVGTTPVDRLRGVHEPEVLPHAADGIEETTHVYEVVEPEAIVAIKYRCCFTLDFFADAQL